MLAARLIMLAWYAAVPNGKKDAAAAPGCIGGARCVARLAGGIAWGMGGGGGGMGGGSRGGAPAIPPKCCGWW